MQCNVMRPDNPGNAEEIYGELKTFVCKICGESD